MAVEKKKIMTKGARRKTAAKSAGRPKGTKRVVTISRSDLSGLAERAKRMGKWTAIALIAVIPATIVGLLVFSIQRNYYNGVMNENDETYNITTDQYDEMLDDLRQRICYDSDAEAGSDDIYVKGTVQYVDGGGSEFSLDDECSSDGLSVKEISCFYKQDATVSPGFDTIPCASGCTDGACMR